VDGGETGAAGAVAALLGRAVADTAGLGAPRTPQGWGAADTAGAARLAARGLADGAAGGLWRESGWDVRKKKNFLCNRWGGYIVS
jgi:hypothetical protein